MQPENIKSLALNLQHAGQMPRSPLITFDQAADLTGLQVDHADIVVEFDDILKKAVTSRVSGITITADTIVFKSGTDITITGELQLITLIARRIVVENDGSARLTLDHSGPSSVRTFNIIAGEIAERFSLASQSGAVHEYDLSKARASLAEKLQLYSYAFRSGNVREGAKPVPIGYLTWDQPLYKTLTASYALAAGLLGENDSNKTYLALTKELLSWILLWSGLESDTAEISRNASNLLSLMPSFDAKRKTLNIPMPPITANRYLLLASTRLNFAKQVELDSTLANMSSSAQDMAAQFGRALSERDRIAAKALADEMESVEQEVRQSKLLINRTSEMILKQQFEQELKDIHLKLELELDKIDKIAKGAIEIAIGLIGIVGSIATIAGGIPADAGAPTKAGRAGVQGLFDALKGTKVDGSFFRTYLNALLMPYTFLWKNKEGLAESIKELAAASVAIMTAVSQINTAVGAHENSDLIAQQVGEAMRSLADKPSAAEATSAWDTIEMEAVNSLNTAIDNSDSPNVKDALTSYKSSVQKTAIYGRLLVDQQARKDEFERRLGSLVLQKIAALDKAASFNEIIKGNPTEAEIFERIKAESAHAMDVARQSFFEASYGFRRAQFYETYSFPAMMPTYCENAASMGKVFNDMETDNSAAPSNFDEFSRKYSVTDAEILERIQNNEAVPLTLPLDMERFQESSHVRLKTMEVRLKSDAATAGLTSITMESDSFFNDRRAGQSVRIDGHRFVLTYEYDDEGVQLKRDFSPIMPTPFATWILKAKNAAGLPKLTSVDITLKGRSTR